LGCPKHSTYSYYRITGNRLTWKIGFQGISKLPNKKSVMIWAFLAPTPTISARKLCLSAQHNDPSAIANQTATILALRFNFVSINMAQNYEPIFGMKAIVYFLKALPTSFIHELFSCNHRWYQGHIWKWHKIMNQVFRIKANIVLNKEATNVIHPCIIQKASKTTYGNGRLDQNKFGPLLDEKLNNLQCKTNAILIEKPYTKSISPERKKIMCYCLQIGA
jgi:hypothetical protein